MHERSSQLFFAPTDLSRFLSCRHLTSLSRSVALGEMSPPHVFEDPRRDALAEAGRVHEAAILERYRAEGLTTETIDPSTGPTDRRERTLGAMRRGVETIYQGRLGGGKWNGYPDFLVRVPPPSALGDWSYEVVDAKLAAAAKADAVLQIAMSIRNSWNKLRARRRRRCISCWASGELERFRVAEFAAFERALRQRFEEHCAEPPRIRIRSRSGFCPRCDWNHVMPRTSGGRTITFPWWPTRRGTSENASGATTRRHHPRRAWRAYGLPMDPPLEGVPACFATAHPPPGEALNSPDANGGCRSTN